MKRSSSRSPTGSSPTTCSELDGIDPAEALRELENDLILVEDEPEPADYPARLPARRCQLTGRIAHTRSAVVEAGGPATTAAG